MSRAFFDHLIISFGICALTITPAGASVLDDKDLPNTHDVSAGIMRGGQPTYAGMSKLAKRGVKSVINLRMEGDAVQEEAKWCDKLGMKFYSIPMDELHEPSHTAITTFLDILRNPESQPVFIHCFSGEDRTGTMIGIYRILENQWTSEKAYKEMLKYGFHPMFVALSDSVFDADEEKNGIAKPAGRPVEVRMRDAMERGWSKFDRDDKNHQRLGARMDLIPL